MMPKEKPEVQIDPIAELLGVMGVVQAKILQLKCDPNASVSLDEEYEAIEKLKTKI